MTKRLRNRAARRLADDCRYWLLHYAGCHACLFDDVRFTRKQMARECVDDYRADPLARYPVRIPRRFWRELGRVVEPNMGVARSRDMSTDDLARQPAGVRLHGGDEGEECLR
jgi:hypothetical protein